MTDETLNQNDDAQNHDAKIAATGDDTDVSASKKEKRIMRHDNPIVLACTAELFRFQNTDQVTTRIRNIKRSFMCADSSEADSVILWVHGFQVTETEDKKGFVGNFACISSKTLSDGTLTLSIYKMPVALNDHPQKKRPKQPHPNNAHPIMRRINKERLYQTQDEAALDLQRLHSDFPDVSIPASEDKLYIIIYDKSSDKKNPVRKVVLKIIELPEGGFKIIMKDNKRRSGGGHGTGVISMMQGSIEM